MNDTDLLTDRLHHLADLAPVPQVPATHDVRRGRGRLRRRRLAGVAGVAVLAVAGGVALGAGGAPGPTTAADPASRSGDPSLPPPEGTSSDGIRLEGVHVGTLVDELSRLSGERSRDDEVRALARVLQMVAEGQDYRRIAIGVADSWRAAGAAGCRTGWTCTSVDAVGDGIRRARQATDGTTTQVAVQLRDEVVVVSFTDADALPAGLPYRTP